MIIATVRFVIITNIYLSGNRTSVLERPSIMSTVLKIFTQHFDSCSVTEWLKQSQKGGGVGNVSISKEEMGLMSKHERAAAAADELSLLLSSVMGSKKDGVKRQNPNFIRIQSDTFVLLQSQCKPRLQGVVLVLSMTRDVQENEIIGRLRGEKDSKGIGRNPEGLNGAEKTVDFIPLIPQKGKWSRCTMHYHKQE